MTDETRFTPVTGSNLGPDWLNSVAIDKYNNVVCAGRGVGGTRSIVVRLSNLLLATSRYTNGDDMMSGFDCIMAGHDGGLICAGWTSNSKTESTGLVVMLDKTLHEVARYTHRDGAYSAFVGVSEDIDGNIIGVGAIRSTGSPTTDAIIVKLSRELKLLDQSIHVTTESCRFDSVVTDSAGNSIAVGSVHGQLFQNALAVKFGPELTPLVSNEYSSSGCITFADVAIIDDNRLVCAGHCVGATCTAVVLILDGRLREVAAVSHAHGDHSAYHAMTIDEAGMLICVGNSADGDRGVTGAVICRMDDQLRHVSTIHHPTEKSQYFDSVTTDSSRNVICSGHSCSPNEESSALVVKFPSEKMTSDPVIISTIDIEVVLPNSKGE